MKTSMIFTAAVSALMITAAASAQHGPGGRHEGGEGRHGGARALIMLGAADLNGDNTVTRSEVEQLHADEFAFRDRNGDGYLDQADASPMMQRMAAMRPDDAEPRRFGRRGGQGPMERLDADEDGRISRAEFIGRELRMFSELDANGDDAVSPDEIDAVIEARQGRRGERREAFQWWRD